MFFETLAGNELAVILAVVCLINCTMKRTTLSLMSVALLNGQTSPDAVCRRDPHCHAVAVSHVPHVHFTDNSHHFAPLHQPPFQIHRMLQMRSATLTAGLV